MQFGIKQSNKNIHSKCEFEKDWCDNKKDEHNMEARKVIIISFFSDFYISCSLIFHSFLSVEDAQGHSFGCETACMQNLQQTVLSVW